MLHSVSCDKILVQTSFLLCRITGFIARRYGDLDRAAAFSSSSCGQIATWVPFIIGSRGNFVVLQQRCIIHSFHKVDYRSQRVGKRAVGQAARAAWHERPLGAADTATAARGQGLGGSIESLSRRPRHVPVRRNASSCNTDGCGRWALSSMAALSRPHCRLTAMRAEIPATCICCVPAFERA